jgi:hypothetical protein
MKIMQLHTALQVNNAALRPVKASWPATAPDKRGNVSWATYGQHDAMHDTYRRDRLIADMDAIINGLD